MDSFPSDVFTSGSAMQANVVMLMAAIISSVHQLRLAEVSGFSGALGSRSCQVHKIRRMLVGEELHEQ